MIATLYSNTEIVITPVKISDKGMVLELFTRFSHYRRIYLRRAIIAVTVLTSMLNHHLSAELDHVFYQAKRWYF